jgi:hypothetical protein
MSITNLYVDQGSSYDATLQITDLDEQALDLTGHSAISQIRKTYTSNTKVDFTVSIGSIPSNGEIRLQLSDSQTSSFKMGKYVYDVRITNSNGESTRVLEGNLTINPSVSR